MKNIIIAVLLLFPLFLYAQDNTQKDFNSLILAELSFSALSESKGIKEAFLTYLDDKSIVFHPKPVNGKELYRNRKETRGTLIWRPDYGGISSSGDFGYTTGPYKFTRDTLKGFGHFATVWHKVDKGNWKVLIDAGISHDPVNLENTGILSLSASTKSKTNFDSAKSAGELITLEKELSNTQKYVDVISSMIRFNVEGMMPISNSDSVKTYIRENRKSMISLPQNAVVSNTGDMGFTYGTMEPSSTGKEQKKLVYMRIWQRENKNWMLVLELSNPLE